MASVSPSGKMLGTRSFACVGFAGCLAACIQEIIRFSSNRFDNESFRSIPFGNIFMRSSIYVLTALVAAGIAYYLASPPTPGEISVASNEVSQPGTEVLADPGTLTLRVDDMHCEYGCFPTVKKTLEGFAHVVSVELDEQPEAGTLDNPQVLLTYQSGFDLAAAQDALAKSGFAKSSVIP